MHQSSVLLSVFFVCSVNAFPFLSFAVSSSKPPLTINPSTADVLPQSSSSAEPLITFQFRHTPAGFDVVEQSIVRVPVSSESSPQLSAREVEDDAVNPRQHKRDYAILTPSIWNALMAKAQEQDSRPFFSLTSAAQSSDNTNRNDLTVANSTCKPVTLLFARGTFEKGNVGTIVGPPFFTALAASLGSESYLSVQGVDYPADVGGFLVGGSANGSSTMYVPRCQTAQPSTRPLTHLSGPPSSPVPSPNALRPKSFYLATPKALS